MQCYKRYCNWAEVRFAKSSHLLWYECNKNDLRQKNVSNNQASFYDMNILWLTMLNANLIKMCLYKQHVMYKTGYANEELYFKIHFTWKHKRSHNLVTIKCSINKQMNKFYLNWPHLCRLKLIPVCCKLWVSVGEFWQKYGKQKY